MQNFKTKQIYLQMIYENQNKIKLHEKNNSMIQYEGCKNNNNQYYSINKMGGFCE